MTDRRQVAGISDWRTRRRSFELFGIRQPSPCPLPSWRAFSTGRRLSPGWRLAPWRKLLPF
jgi:hypothetical protein